MKGKSRVLWVVVLCAAASSARATVVIDTVPVGNPNNAPDTRYATPGYGSVDHTFNMGKFEITAGQYTAFLNAVAATDTYGLYNPLMWSDYQGCKIERSGDPGSYTYEVLDDPDVPGAEWANRPVNFVSWGSAARFANWLHNGQPTGPQGLSTTEDGSYFLNGATSNAALQAVVREPDATWVIPSEDEWYKAAYHKNDGVTGNYWDYPTGSDSVPSNQLIDPDPGNNGNFLWSAGSYTLGSPYWRTEVGEFEKSESPYGTFDQGGNVWEWNEVILTDGSYRGLRGGGFDIYAGYGLYAADREGDVPTLEYQIVGFRVATVAGPRGDVNCDGAVDFDDINPFVAALVGRSSYEGAYPNCRWLNGDINGDQSVDFDDINPFVACLVSGGCQ